TTAPAAWRASRPVSKRMVRVPKRPLSRTAADSNTPSSTSTADDCGEDWGSWEWVMGVSSLPLVFAVPARARPDPPGRSARSLLRPPLECDGAVAVIDRSPAVRDRRATTEDRRLDVGCIRLCRYS